MASGERHHAAPLFGPREVPQQPVNPPRCERQHRRRIPPTSPLNNSGVFPPRRHSQWRATPTTPPQIGPGWLSFRGEGEHVLQSVGRPSRQQKPPLDGLPGPSFVTICKPFPLSPSQAARIDIQTPACFNLPEQVNTQPEQLALPFKQPPHPTPPMATVTQPPQAPSDWKPQAQTEEQVAEGLREAFRQAVREGVVTSQSDQRRNP